MSGGSWLGVPYEFLRASGPSDAAYLGAYNPNQGSLTPAQLETLPAGNAGVPISSDFFLPELLAVEAFLLHEVLRVPPSMLWQTVIALNILWSGWQLVRVSVGGLMDEAVPAETLDTIREIISSNADGALEAHDVRTRHAGSRTFIDFHLVVPGDMTVSRAHEICDRIERALRDEVDDALISIHVEPEEKAKHQGVVVL